MTAATVSPPDSEADVQRALAIYSASAQAWEPSNEWEGPATRAITAYARLDGRACADALLDYLGQFPKGGRYIPSHSGLAVHIEERLASADSRVLFDTLLQGRVAVQDIADAAARAARRLAAARRADWEARELHVTCAGCS